MGIVDILKENNLDYNELVDLLYDLNDVVQFDVNKVVGELDSIYDERSIEASEQKSVGIRATIEANKEKSTKEPVKPSKEHAIGEDR